MGNSIGDYFGMIAGTSIGGIIALALSRGLTASEISHVYVERGGNILPPLSRLRRVWHSLRRLQRYPYEREPLQNELLRIFGDAAFGEARTRLCIASFEGRYGEPWIYKTPHHPDYKRDRHASMVTVGLATAAAPTFFAALPNNGYVMVDGELWADNPIMSAIVDALTCFEIERRQIRVLSLGCGETSFKVDAKKAKGGLFHWWNIYWAAMRAQSHNALGQACLLVGKDQVIRLDAPESDDPIDLYDYIRAKAELPLMARSLVEAGGESIWQKFFDFPADQFTACPASKT